MHDLRRLALFLLVGSWIGCGVGEAAVIAPCRMFDTNADRIVRRRIKSSEAARLTAALADRSLPYPEREEATLALIGETRKAVMKSVAVCLIEPRVGPGTTENRKAREEFLAACADVLKWAAVRGDRSCLDVLYKALLAEHIYIGEGRAIMRAILDVEGAQKVLHAILAPLRRESSPCWGRATHPFPHKYTSVLSWYDDSCHGSHYGLGVDPRDVLTVEARQVSNVLRRMSDREVMAFFGDERAVDGLERLFTDGLAFRHPYPEWTNGEMLRDFVAGLSRRSPEVQRAVCRWVHDPSGYVYALQRPFYALDGSLVRELGACTGSLLEKRRQRMEDFLRRLCHGRMEDVVAGRRTFEEVVLEEMAKSGPWPHYKYYFDQYAQFGKGVIDNTKVPFRASPWDQALFIPIRFNGETRHPLLDVLLDPMSSDADRYYCAAMLPCAAWTGALGDRTEGLSDSIASTISPRRPEEKRFNVLPERLAYAALHVAPKARQADMFIAFMRDARFDVGFRYRLLDMCAWKLYAWGPKAVLDAADRMVSRERFTPGEGKTDWRVFLWRPLLALTPERLPEPLASGKRPQEEQEELAAAWRAWLERFRKLPVFRKGR